MYKVPENVVCGQLSFSWRNGRGIRKAGYRQPNLIVQASANSLLSGGVLMQLWSISELHTLTSQNL